jgi:hypothetical protein
VTELSRPVQKMYGPFHFTESNVTSVALIDMLEKFLMPIFKKAVQKKTYSSTAENFCIFIFQFRLDFLDRRFHRNGCAHRDYKSGA